MAEALAVVGVVSNIVQIIDFSSQVLHRLGEFESSLGDIPETFRHIKAELPVLQDTLQQTKEAIDAGFVKEEARGALLPAIEGCRQQIASLDAVLLKILPAQDDSWGRRGRKAILSLTQDAKVESIIKILRGYIGTLTFYYAATSSTLRPLTDEKLSKIRQWLSAPDPSLNYQKALKQRQAETGAWFLESEQYAKWKTDAASFLWLYGIPGCGKTVLSSTILQNIFQYCADDPGRVVGYFYFDFNDSQKQVPELMVRSLISQLSQQCVKVSGTLETLFSSWENRQRHPSLDDCLEVLQRMIQEFPQSYIILDALDECANRAELMDILESMAGWRLEGLHVLVTSRKERDIENSLEDFVDKQNTICLQSKLVDRDIYNYVRQRLSDDKNLRKWQKHDDIRQEIETTLMKGAQGMFRWAVCQLDTLGKCRNRSKLRESLATLPPTLDETYERILCAINTDDSDYAVRILRWLAYSTRPLLVEEISEVIAIDPERDPAFDRQEVLEDPLEVLNICSTLVTIATTEKSGLQKWEDRSRSTTKVVLLAHYSVKEYLISERCGQGRAAAYSMQNPTCHEFIAMSCLKYILQFRRPASLTNGNIEESKLAQYSAEFWTTHFRMALHKEEVLSRLIMKLFSTGNDAYLNWIRIYDPDHPGQSPDVTRKLESVPSPLYYASLLSLTQVMNLLIHEAGADVNAEGGVYGNALQAASSGGHDRAVELLLDKGANVNAQGGEYGNALQAASSGGHGRVVERLLGKGADVNAQGGEYGNALQAASSGGYDRVVELLLGQGADVNTQGGEYGNALQAASSRGHDMVVELLLGKGADVNAQGGRYGNALQAASLGGHDRVVELLLSKGADVNTQGGEYGNALQAASLGGHGRVVELLLGQGADVSAQGGEYGNALQAASLGGHGRVVERLLDKGADVNAQGGEYGNALQAASSRGHGRVIELLLGQGADVNTQGGYYGNALQAASLRGHGKVVELLLGRGADINAQGGEYGNALQAASLRCHGRVVELLLSKGADVSAQGGEYGNALQAASLGGHSRVVELLLGQGADVNTPGGVYGNALQAASLRGHGRIVERLLDKGADVNAQGGEYGNALQAASSRCHDSIVELLLNKGADVNAQGGRYGNALRAASSEGHGKVVKLLLSKGAEVKA